MACCRRLLTPKGASCEMVLWLLLRPSSPCMAADGPPKVRCRRTSPGSSPSLAASSTRRRPPKLYAPLQRKSPISASGSSATSNTAQPSATCSMSSCRKTRHRGRPVLIFVHGGAFIGGNKRTPGQPVLRQHHAVGGEERLHRRQHHLPPRAAISLARRRRGYRIGCPMGFGQYRRTRRRSFPHLPDGPLGRRDACRKLCVASGVLQGEGRRPERRDHGVRAFTI